MKRKTYVVNYKTCQLLEFGTAKKAGEYIGCNLTRVSHAVTTGYLLNQTYFVFYDIVMAIHRRDDIKSGWKARTRGSDKRGTKKYYPGMNFGKTTIIDIVDRVDGTYILCKCECGNYAEMPLRVFNDKVIKYGKASCGCSGHYGYQKGGKYVVNPPKNLNEAGILGQSGQHKAEYRKRDCSRS